MAKKPVTEKIEIGCSYTSLAALLEQLQAKGISPTQYSNLSFDFDWSDCYYEGDRPSIQLTGTVERSMNA